MRDKIVVYEKIAFKTVKRLTSPYEKRTPYKAVSVVGQLLSLPSLDHIYCSIYGASRCILHSGWWR
jgi:hypothetical protein